MTTKIDICNRALSIIGQERISNLTEATAAAKELNLFYDVARREVLRLVDWGFAHRTSKLALLPQKLPHWKFTYSYPVECLFLKKVFAEGHPLEKGQYREENTANGKAIVCNLETAWAEYTVDVQDENLFDASFVSVLAYALATYIAKKLTGSEEDTQKAYQLYMQKADEAAYHTKMEEKIYPARRCSYTEVR